MEDVELLLQDFPPLLGDMSALDDAILGAGPVPAAPPSGGYLSSKTYASSSGGESETMSSPDSSGSATEDYEEELLEHSSSRSRKRSLSTLAKPAAVVPRPSRRKRPAVLVPQSDSSVTSGDSSFAKQPATAAVPQIRELQCNGVKAVELKPGKQSKVAMIEERKARNRASAERSRQRRMQYTATLEGQLEVAESRITELEKSQSAMKALLLEMLSTGTLAGSKFENEAKNLCASSVVGKTQPTVEQLRREEHMAELAADHHLSGSVIGNDGDLLLGLLPTPGISSASTVAALFLD